MRDIKLSEKMDLKYASELKAELMSSLGMDVHLNGTQVSAVYATCCQLLVAAKVEWKEGGNSFSISPSEKMIGDLEMLGEKELLIFEEDKS